MEITLLSRDDLEIESRNLTHDATHFKNDAPDWLKENYGHNRYPISAYGIPDGYFAIVLNNNQFFGIKETN